jgi:hypothetical protein
VLKPGRDTRWGLLSAAAGGLSWLFLLCATLAGLASVPSGPIGLLFLLFPLVVVPLGLELAAGLVALPPGTAGRRALPRTAVLARALQPVAAALAAASFWLPRGIPGGLLASGWLLECMLAGIWGLDLLRRRSSRDLVSLCAIAGLLYLPAGGAGLVFSRLGANPRGFEEPLLILFAVHFHASGFGAPILAAALGRRLRARSPKAERAFSWVAPGVLGGPLLLATGYVLDSPIWKLLAVHLIVVSLLALAVLHLPVLVSPLRPLPRLLLAISAAGLAAAMALAALYGIGDYLGRITIDIPRMALTHGSLNALGFLVSGMAGWLCLHSDERGAP